MAVLIILVTGSIFTDSNARTLGSHAEMMPFEFIVAALFIGVIMWGVGDIYKKFSGGKTILSSKKVLFTIHNGWTKEGC